MSVSIARLRSLAAQKGLTVGRHPWRDRVRLLCRNGAAIHHYPEGYSAGMSGFEHRHALRYLLGLPDA